MVDLRRKGWWPAWAGSGGKIPNRAMAPAWAKLCSRKRVAPVEAPVRGPSPSGQLRRFQWAPVGSCDQCALIADSSMRHAFRSHKPQMHACGSRTTVALPPTNSSVTALSGKLGRRENRRFKVHSLLFAASPPLSKSRPRPATHPYNPRPYRPNREPRATRRRPIPTLSALPFLGLPCFAPGPPHPLVPSFPIP